MKEIKLICYDKGFEVSRDIIVLEYPVMGDIITHENKEYIVKYRSIHAQISRPWMDASVSVVVEIQ